MKKIISIIALLFMFAGYSLAGKTILVTVNEADSTQTHEIAENVSLTFRLTDAQIKDGDAIVKIEINNQSSNGVFIFDKAYTEKELKKALVKFARSFPGTRGQRCVMPAEGINNMVLMSPSNTIGDSLNQSREIYTVNVYDGIKDTLTIPFYLVEYKKHSGYSRVKKIVKKGEVAIEFDVHLAEPREYVEIKEELDSLKRELANLTFCDNPKHSPSLDEQKAVYVERIKAIQERIDSVKRANGWNITADERSKTRVKTDIFNKFKKLEEELHEVDINNVPLQDCGGHKVAAQVGHRCKYCSYTFDQLVNQLENIYFKISNSDDPAAVMQKYSSDVRKIEDCAKRRRGYSNSKSKKSIEEFIHRINGL